MPARQAGMRGVHAKRAYGRRNGRGWLMDLVGRMRERERNGYCEASDKSELVWAEAHGHTLRVRHLVGYRQSALAHVCCADCQFCYDVARSFPPHRRKEWHMQAIIFDLDGTLWDSTGEVCTIY